MTPRPWLDRVAGAISPHWQLRRVRARVAVEMLQRTYDAATIGRRTQTWRRNSSDANAVIGPTLSKLRDLARDLVRNNPYAASVVLTILDQAVGWGIVAAQKHPQFEAWSNSTACDADGRCDLAGLTKLVMRTVVESGEVIVRRRWRLLTDGLPLPFQLQVLEPDFLDTYKDSATLPNGGRIVQGVEFDALGRRVAYWLYREHPGSTLRPGGTLFGNSSRVPAEDIAHVFRGDRPGQVRGPSWFAPLLLTYKDFDELSDATLMKQKVAACLAVVTSDSDGTSSPLGTEDPDDEEVDLLSPGAVLNIPPGRTVYVVQPPNVREYPDYVQTVLRSLATGIGVTYEDFTGDYTDLPFSAARMSRLRQQARVDDWRYRMLIPQFLNRVWEWGMQGAAIIGVPGPATTEWTPPPMPFIDPSAEGLAVQRNIRTGIQTLSDAIRERGYVPKAFFDEMEADYKDLDRRQLVLDSDPRKMTQAGQMQAAISPDGTLGGQAFRGDLDRFADFLARLPEEQGLRVFQAMFGDTK